jgi:hypothetical protein
MCAQLPPKGHVTSTAQQIQNKADLERTCEAVLPVSGGCRKTGGKEEGEDVPRAKILPQAFYGTQKRKFFIRLNLVLYAPRG